MFQFLNAAVVEGLLKKSILKISEISPSIFIEKGGFCADAFRCFLRRCFQANFAKFLRRPFVRNLRTATSELLLQ